MKKIFIVGAGITANEICKKLRKNFMFQHVVSIPMI